MHCPPESTALDTHCPVPASCLGWKGWFERALPPPFSNYLRVKSGIVDDDREREVEKEGEGYVCLTYDPTWWF